MCTSERTLRYEEAMTVVRLYLRADVEVLVYVPQSGRSGASVCTSERTFRCQCVYLRADVEVRGSNDGGEVVPQGGR